MEKSDHCQHGNESYHRNTKHIQKKLDLYDLRAVWNCFEWFKMIIIFGCQN